MRTKTKKTASDNAQQTSLDDALSIKNALSIKIDPELGRVAMGLGVACEFRVWSVARHFYGIPGWVERETLFHTLKSARVVTTKRNFNRLLRTGDGLFWSRLATGFICAAISVSPGSWSSIPWRATRPWSPLMFGRAEYLREGRGRSGQF